MKRLLLACSTAGALIALAGAAHSQVTYPQRCNNIAPIAGSIRYDDAAGNCNILKINPDGSVNVTGGTGGGGSGSISATASTAAPTYTAGPQSLSLDLNGNLRTTGANDNSPTPPGSNNIGRVSIDPTANTVQSQGSASLLYSTLTNYCYAYGSPATLYAIAGNAPAGALWVEVFNATAKPTDASGLSPAWYFPVTAGGFSYGFLTPLSLATGDTVCFSSAADPTTLTTASGLTGTGRLVEQHN